MPRWLTGIAIGLFVALAGALLSLAPVGSTFEENVGLRWLFTARGNVQAPDEVVVVAINESTANHLELPALPRDWPRSIHGRLIDNLVNRGASVVAFDMDFSRARDIEEDLTLADAVAEAERVVLIERLDTQRQPVKSVDGTVDSYIWTEHSKPPIPPLAAAARGIAPFPLPKVQEAVFQFWVFKASLGDAATLPAATLQLLALDVYPIWLGLLRSAGVAVDEIFPPDSADILGAEALREVMRRFRMLFKSEPGLASRIRADLDAEINASLSERERQLLRALLALYAGANNRYLNFYGSAGSIQTIPYHRIIANPETPQPQVQGSNDEFPDLQGKTVFVGYSDLYNPGQPDRFYTVFTRDDGVDLSGVEIAATGFANLLTDASIRPSDTVLTLATISLIGVLTGTIVFLLPALVGVPVVLAFVGLYAFGAQQLFETTQHWLPLAIPALVQLPLALLVGLIGQYLIQRRAAQRASKALTYYLPENVAREFSKDGVETQSLNKVVYGVCLATDMAGFTTLSEGMSPQELAQFMNEYFEALVVPLKHNSVDITEFRADAIMCAWTAENPSLQVRVQAIMAALGIKAAVQRFNALHEGVNLQSRVGLDAGMIYLGHSGGGGQFVYSILGDSANTASRIESLNKQLDTHLLSAGDVIDGLASLLVRPLGEFIFVGKNEPTPVFEIFADTSDATKEQQDLCTRFGEAMEVYYEARWNNAADMLERVAAEFDDGPSRFYLARCRHFLQGGTPPENPRIVTLDKK